PRTATRSRTAAWPGRRHAADAGSRCAQQPNARLDRPYRLGNRHALVGDHDPSPEPGRPETAHRAPSGDEEHPTPHRSPHQCRSRHIPSGAVQPSVFFKIVDTIFALSRLLHSRLFFWVQCRRPNRFTISHWTFTPARWGALLGHLQYPFALLQQHSIFAIVALFRCYEAQLAVTVLSVIPANEPVYP